MCTTTVLKPATKTVRKTTRGAVSVSLGMVLVLASWPHTVLAHQGPSEASEASALSIAISVATPMAVSGAVLSGGAVLTVVSVQAVVGGTQWVLARASDGARISLTMAGASVIAAGTAVTVVVTGTGWVLSQAGKALCFIPNEIGASLLYNEPVTR